MGLYLDTPITNIKASCAIATDASHVANDYVAKETPLTIDSTTAASIVEAVKAGAVEKVCNFVVVVLVLTVIVVEMITASAAAVVVGTAAVDFVADTAIASLFEVFFTDTMSPFDSALTLLLMLLLVLTLGAGSMHHSSLQCEGHFC